MIYLDKKERLDMLEKHGFCIHISNDKNVKLHGHSFLEFTYIRKGTVVHSINGTTETLTEGDYFIVDYGTQHKYKSADGNENSVINLLFYPSFIDRSLGRWDDFEKVVNSYLIRFKYRSLKASPSAMVFHDSSRTVCNILDSLLLEYEQQDAGYLEYIRSLITQILIITMRKISKGSGETQESGIIKEITDSIKKSYQENLRLSDYAEKYSYSLSHISKRFTEEMGVGFTVYLQTIRIEKACALLEGSRITVGEAAAAVGYSDIKSFNRIFKKIIGLTPGEFKKISK